ncbi:hypothetical protein M9978_02265 [Sphingomonas sp. MG17]|uniref:Uncharacterized protein n=1 Tax=Sphingomonas tagetis TaxID=2949092 RepID=A0A9X2HNT9_9SPHN|nr:hypothetical protein [Sphingomonas tagetis]MCP3729240.1 hypothetical protein [Sphingomonas tagetis]
MATVHVTISKVDDRGDTGASVQLITSVPTAAETMTSSGSSAQAAITPSKADGLFWSVTATANVWIAFGANPTAVSGAGHLILGGQTRDFAVTSAGEKIAVKDA